MNTFAQPSGRVRGIAEGGNAEEPDVPERGLDITHHLRGKPPVGLTQPELIGKFPVAFFPESPMRRDAQQMRINPIPNQIYFGKAEGQRGGNGLTFL